MAGSGERFLFWITREGLWKQVDWRGSSEAEERLDFWPSGAPAMDRENQITRIAHPVVLITAAGLQGEKPLVSRRK